jgi:glycosyltransferase involved in cell wall biosynthesis
MIVTQPPLTVITVVYNAKDNIEGCIESVLAQKIHGLEYIIIDGGSTDGTLDVIKRYDGKITRLISERDSGLYDAMNKGLKLATGRFIHFLNSDDRYASSQVLASIIPKLDPAAMCYGQMHYIDGDLPLKLLGRPFEWSEELRASSVPQPVMFVSPELYRQVGEFDTSLRIAADYDMVLRLAGRFPVKYIAEPVTTMYSGGLSYTRPDLTFSEAMQVSQRHGLSATQARLIYWRRWLKWHLKGLFRNVLSSLGRSRRPV